MKELQNILAEIEGLERSGDSSAVLATVVDVKGSSYRLPGAKMLVFETGETMGIVSGGCLEADVAERAKQVLRTGKPQIITYDTSGKDDSVFSLNMGCNGIVQILLEPAAKNRYFDFVRKCFETRQSIVAATLIRASAGNNLPEIGSRAFMGENEIWESDFGKEVEEILFAESQNALQNDHSRCQTLLTSAGNVEFFLEVIKPPISLVVFGAGADAVPLVETAKNIGWRVSIYDHRPAFAARERFPTADEIKVSRYDNLIVEPMSVVVVMTHNYEHDKRILPIVLKSGAQYVGILGPKRRAQNLLKEIEETGVNFTFAELQKLYAPVGLDIGADTPETIAVSIVTEINSVVTRREGGFLKNREGSIYNRNGF